MKLKEELTLNDRLDCGGKYVSCDNPECLNAYHYMRDVSYNILHQDRADGLIIDLGFCSLDCLKQVDPIKETLGVKAECEDSQ